MIRAGYPPPITSSFQADLIWLADYILNSAITTAHCDHSEPSSQDHATIPHHLNPTSEPS